MPVGITDLAYSLRKSTVRSALPISLSHGQQLVCAALGHRSLASFQAAQAAKREPQAFDGLAHVVPDFDQLNARAQELGLLVAEGQLRTLILAAFKDRLPVARVHCSYVDLAMHVQEEIEEAVLVDERVNAEMACANYDGVEEVYLEVELDPEQAAVNEALKVNIPGQVSLGIDTERPYNGDEVRFEVAVTLVRCGRRCFEGTDIEVVAAALDQDWGDTDD